MAVTDRNILTKLETLRALVNKQAEDHGLWFAAMTAPEAYLQQELRKLHTAVEAALQDEPTSTLTSEPKRYIPGEASVLGDPACKCVEVDAGGCVGWDVANCPRHNPDSPNYVGRDSVNRSS